jgi:hypothetical protein
MKSKGFINIVIPILILVTAFAFMLTSGKMFNISTTNPNEKYESPVTSGDSQKKNLQLKKLTFKPKPTPIRNACNHDMSKKVDPNVCTNCIAWLVYCKDNACVDVDTTKSKMPGDKTTVCPEFENSGWCRTLAMEGDGWYCIGKPVIYLYPTIPTLVNVKIRTEGAVVVSDPQIEKENGWTNVMAHPNGILFYNDQPFRELFYESEAQNVSQPKAGFVFKKENLKKELTDFIEKLGLTREDEKDEFLEWWLPRLEAFESPYWFVSILEKDEKRRIDEVTISPKPDTFIEFIAYFKPLENAEEVEKLILPPTPQRKGFTAVEWGGVIGK